MEEIDVALVDERPKGSSRSRVSCDLILHSTATIII